MMSRLFIICYAFAAATASLSVAQERSYLIVDASGSMWGQIDGVSKIVILRENMRNVLETLSGSSEVGVFAFGHREKGQCSDIEEVMPLQPFDGKKISEVLDGIKPKGKTPLADAIRTAAAALRYSEEKATVVILGDGKENCIQEDPCKVVEDLEETGVDFTVHSVAFDIADKEAMEDLRCIAEVTGGEFVTANNIPELTKAIERITVAVAPEAAPFLTQAQDVPKEASKGVRLTLDGVSGAADWTLINKETEDVLSFKAASGTIKTGVPAGEYDVYVSVGDAFGEAELMVQDDGAGEVIVSLGGAVAKPLEIDVDTVPAGSEIRASWSLEPANKDIVFIARKSDASNSYPIDRHSYHDVRRTTSGSLVVPATPGRYEVRYFRFGVGGALHRVDLTVTAPEVTIEAPSQLRSGQTITARVAGPMAPGDFLFIAKSSWSKNQYPLSQHNQAPAARSAQLTAPSGSGLYEYRYFSFANGESLFSKPVKIVLDEARVASADKVAAGSVFSVEFSGPRYPKDVLFITPASTDYNRYMNGDGDRRAALGTSPARLVAPAKAGTYEVRYYSPDHGGLLATSRFIVRAPEISLTAPRVVQRGASVKIDAQGPGAPGDVVFIADLGMGERQYPGSADQRGKISSTEQQTVTLHAPGRTGTYEIRYFSWENGAVLSRRKIIVR